MIYIVIGGSHAGKTSFVYNSFVKGFINKEYKDILTICENEKYFLIGKYLIEERTKGTDRISRKDIPKFFQQIKKIYNKGKDVIIEGDKIASRTLFNQILEANLEVKLFFLHVSFEKSIERNKRFGSTSSERQLKAVCTKAENLFFDYCGVFDGEKIDTDDIENFSEFSIFSIQKKEKKKKQKMRDDFAVFILTYGRANNVITEKTLKRQGYTGKWYIVIDNEDDQEDEYRRVYGDKVLQVDKLAISKTFDTMDTQKDRRTIVYARNACFDLAKQVGVRFFLELYDDYTAFMYRYPEGDKLMYYNFKNLDEAFSAIVDFLIDTKADTVAFAQGGDFIGSLDSGTYLKSFYSVMGMMSAVRIQEMGGKNKRIHHAVEWESCVPMILNECYKKRSEMNGE